MAAGKQNIIVDWFRRIVDGLKAAWRRVLKEVELLTRSPGAWLWRLVKGTWRTLVRFVRWIVLLPVMLVSRTPTPT